MKAVVRDRYGSPDVLRLKEIPTPTPADNEVLVKVHVAAVNKGDWEILQGCPLWVRLVGFGLMRPKTRILGWNVAGRIEANSEAVSQFEVGDEIRGDILYQGLSAFAEYVCVPRERSSSGREMLSPLALANRKSVRIGRNRLRILAIRR